MMLQALILHSQSPSTYAGIAYVHALMGNLQESVDWFHKALSLRRDDTFSSTMLNYVIEQLCEHDEPYLSAPSEIPDFEMFTKEIASDANTESVVNETGNSEMDMSMEV